jgi:hypothetical protein
MISSTNAALRFSMGISPEVLEVVDDYYRDAVQSLMQSASRLKQDWVSGQ